MSLSTGGLEVTGVDVNGDIVERVNRGERPFAEPDLSVAVSGAVAMGRLRAQREMPQADAYVIAVPTPFTGDHQADLSYVTAAPEAIADVLSGGEVIVLESTAPPGTTRRVSELIGKAEPHAPSLPRQLDEFANVAIPTPSTPSPSPSDRAAGRPYPLPCDQEDAARGQIVYDTRGMWG